MFTRDYTQAVWAVGLRQCKGGQWESYVEYDVVTLKKWHFLTQTVEVNAY